MAPTICFVHTGDSWYLWYTLRQARLTNPNADIILIGDRHLPHYDPFVRHVAIQDYFGEAAAFAKIYQHLSTNSHGYELFCFQRWFILKEYVERHAIDRCVYLDSDVMVYSDLGIEQACFADVDLTVTKGKNPQNMFVGGPAALERFCAFVTELYTRRAAELQERYRVYRASHAEGGICDMTALDDYAQTYPERVADTAVIRDASTYDNNIRRSDGFAMRRRVKDLTWIDGRPYARHIATGQLVRFHSIHFQGGSKLLIPYFAHQRNLDFYRRLVFQTPLRRTARGLLLLAGR